MKAKPYRKQVEVTGSVTQINTGQRTFTIGTDSGLPVKAPYTDDTEESAGITRHTETPRSPRVTWKSVLPRSAALGV